MSHLHFSFVADVPRNLLTHSLEGCLKPLYSLVLLIPSRQNDSGEPPIVARMYDNADPVASLHHQDVNQPIFTCTYDKAETVALLHHKDVQVLAT